MGQCTLITAAIHGYHIDTVNNKTETDVYLVSVFLCLSNEKIKFIIKKYDVIMVIFQF